MNQTGALEFNLLGQDLLLLPQKAIYWKQQQTLIAADVHLGKVGHFRKAGIAVPRDMEQDDLAVLSDLIDEYQPKKILFLGDLFHSDKNADWDWFAMWRQNFPNIEVILIKGNHDIIHEKHYHQLNVATHISLTIGPFLMLHHPLSSDALQQIEAYSFCGHIHPGVSLRGRGRQHLTLPCFAFSGKQVILPSFGKFTGKVAMRHPENDRIFGVLNDKVIAL